MEYQPDFTLEAEGRDITHAIRQGLVSIRLTDYGGATGQTDTLAITLTSETLTLPKNGARLTLGLGFNGNITAKGLYVVCAVESSGPPRELTITATAAPTNSQKQPADTTAQRERAFDDTTLGDIMKTIAAENGLKPRISPSLARIVVKHEDQSGESDGAFMLRLARRYNAVSKPASGYWVFMEQGAAERASGKPTALWTFTPEQVTGWSYREGDRSGARGEKKGKVKVKYNDPFSGETKIHEQEHDGPDMMHPHVQADEDSAKHAANAAVTQVKKSGRQMSLRGPVRPDIVRMTAECRVQTQGFGVREDHLWQVESVDYSLSKSGFTFALSLKNDLSDGKKEKEKEKVANPYS